MRNVQVMGWVILVVGAALTAWGWFNLDQGRASRGWPTAEATIESSQVISRRSSSTTGTRSGRRYNPEIRFEFTVDGKPYTGDRVSFRDDHYGKREPAAEIAARYPVGSTVTVYYPPENPAEAVLEPTYDWSTYIPPGIGLFFFVTGAFLLRVKRQTLLAQKVPEEPI